MAKEIKRTVFCSHCGGYIKGHRLEGHSIDCTCEEKEDILFMGWVCNNCKALNPEPVDQCIRCGSSN